jgi:hypothetical protein
MNSACVKNPTSHPHEEHVPLLQPHFNLNSRGGLIFAHDTFRRSLLRQFLRHGLYFASSMSAIVCYYDDDDISVNDVYYYKLHEWPNPLRKFSRSENFWPEIVKKVQRVLCCVVRDRLSEEGDK